MYGITFDTAKIKTLVKDFYLLTGIHMSFCSYDRSVRIWANSKGDSKDTLNFCEILRKDKRANQRCQECDRQAFEIACSNQSIYIYRCHAGLTEAIAPILIENKVIGYLIMGKILDSIPTKELWENSLEQFKQYNIDFNALQKAFFQLPSISWERIRAAASIVEMSSKFIYLSQVIKIQEPQLIQKIKEYIEINISNNISISGLSEYLNISRSHLSHVIKAELGYSLTEYTLIRRIEKAKTLLEQTSHEVSRISELVGFADQNYFSRVFKKFVGHTPRHYRALSIESRV